MSTLLCRRAAAGLLLCLAALALAPRARAETAVERLAKLKQVVQAQADHQAYPITGIDPADVRAVLATLKSASSDAWAAAWTAMGDKRAARAANDVDPAVARKNWQQAWLDDMFGAWPAQTTPGKRAAYEKSIAAFRQYGKLLEFPVETVRIPFAGGQIVGYLQVPKSGRPVPAVLNIGGLDEYKEYTVAHTTGAMLKAGLATFSIDMPGTGESPVKMAPDSERMIIAALNYLRTRPEIDPNRIAVNGASAGGYWSALTAYDARNLIKAAVVRGGPIHYYFEAYWQRKSWGTNEYLFGLKEARLFVYGFKPDQERQFLADLPRFSLLNQGILDKPSAPMLVVNGAKDTQVPIADLYLLLRTGSPKYAWVNPDGGHTGRSAGWSDQQINDKVVVPWLVTMLAPGAS